MLGITLVIITFVVIYFYCKNKLNYWNKLSVPNLNPGTPLGDLTYCITHGKNLNVLFKEVALNFKKKGHKYYGFYITLSPIFVPIDFEIIKNILFKDNEYFLERGVYIDTKKVPLGDNFFCVRGNKWKYMRDMIKKSLTAGKLKNMTPLIENYSNIFCDKIAESNEKPIKIFRLAKFYALDVACSAFFGVDEQNLEKGNPSLINFCESMNRVSIKNLLKVIWEDGLGNPAYIFKAFLIDKDINKFIFDYCDKIYKLRKETDIEKEDFLSILINAYENEDEENFDMCTFAGQVLILFFATFDTSSNAITYVLYELGKRKDCQERLREEILNAIDGDYKNLTADVLGELDYLDRFATECLRVHTIVATINRCCTKDYKIPESDLIIKKGTPVVISLLAVHNDPEYFPEPEKFDPDRYIDPIRKQYIMSFGYGQHYCLGVKLAKCMIKMAVAKILLKYDVEVNPMTGSKLENIAVSRSVTWSYKNTFWLEFKKRQANI